MAQTVTIDFNANLVKFAGQVDKATDQLNKFQAKAETIGTRVNSALSGIGVGLSLAGLGAFVKSGIDAADALNDLSDRTGIAIEKLAGLQYAVKIGDTSLEAFQSSANKLSINIAKNAETFKNLGISAKDPVEAFKQLADLFSSIQDPQTRAAVGAAAMGKAYAEMAPLLLMGSAGIQALIDKGIQLNPITAEQARRAGEFNDKLEALSAQTLGFRSHLAMYVLEPLAALAEGIDTNIQKFGILQGLFQGIAEGAENFAVGGFNRGLSKELDDINRQIALKKQQLAKAQSGEEFIGEGREVGLAREINRLLKQRETLIQNLHNQRQPAAPTVAPTDKNLKELLKLSEDKADQVAQKAIAAAEKLNNTYDTTAAALRREIALRENNTAAAQMEYDVQYGSLQTLTEAQKIKLLNLAAEKDYLDQNSEALKENNSIVEQGIELSRKQQIEMERNYNRLHDKFNPGLSDLNAGVEDVDMALKMHIITPAQAQIEFDKLGQAYNESFIEKAKAGTDDLSQFAIQGARNIQTAFADFLFSPAETGFDGLAANFAKALARMAANAASAGIMDLLLGKNFGSSNAAGGGLLQQAGSFIASFFHDGGTVGAGGRTAAMPAALFAAAPRLHAGGFLRSDEVPAILQTGEMVLNRRQVAGLSSATDNVQITTTVNVSGNKNSEENNNLQQLGKLINSRIRDVIITEKRPGGLLA